jgi:hypothetical protein
VPEDLSRPQLGQPHHHAYASALFGHDIEIHVDNDGLREFFGMVRDAAEGWDGSAPLRPAPS